MSVSPLSVSIREFVYYIYVRVILPTSADGCPDGLRHQHTHSDILDFFFFFFLFVFFSVSVQSAVKNLRRGTRKEEARLISLDLFLALLCFCLLVASFGVSSVKTSSFGVYAHGNFLSLWRRRFGRHPCDGEWVLLSRYISLPLPLGSCLSLLYKLFVHSACCFLRSPLPPPTLSLTLLLPDLLYNSVATSTFSLLLFQSQSQSQLHTTKK
ncbi:hypothetical protein Kpol_529p29 [Vanderwaltozyma polyspora DSM 70294]|uniref:Uncharacterized protein n=1 Tax=Vanderwaltozyma polyspora (strain ATCC 22028 / DSM 70294 / BCRC 21397 / CBS 2163 / NBRC 10782 / NRRL Y-8283 / UCD 57-17) TaxID=436907 RepID=A7TM82_VANPO|nr:uncharacterized protein Kpol_529p29 [Vanderwaltozyma polyspora DSM 70294]EDO16649.1 hypothetical protein Kpol_529p29 [Vanderwaltozyma polyspora DSM 70294]